MKSKFFRTVTIVFSIFLLLVIGILAAGAIAKTNLAKQYPAPGQMVDVGGYQMHINCIGQGSPTVILEAGWSDFSLLWAYVQPEVANFTRVCSYDRAGYGWSEPSPHPRTAITMVEELHMLLVNANIKGPYVLVGHSMGGVLVRVFADTYPEDVLGMVLVDSVHEDIFIDYPEAAVEAIEDAMGQFRMLGFLNASGILAFMPQNIPNRGLPDNSFANYQAILATTNYFQTSIAEWNSEEVSYSEVRSLQITNFGDLPLIVLSRGLQEPNPLISEIDNQKMWEVMQEWQSELVGLSSQGKQVIAEQSGHNIQLDQPDLVIEAIREILHVIRE
jgi:pimeloyl-ACP methyl ester carboxylesterase